MKHKPATPPAGLDALFPEQSAAATVPTSLRFSASLLARIDAIAKARGVTRTAAIERLLRHALAMLEPDETLEELQARRRRAGTVKFSMKLGKR
jgi:predicted transcriptional regulator